MANPIQTTKTIKCLVCGIDLFDGDRYHHASENPKKQPRELCLWCKSEVLKVNAGRALEFHNEEDRITIIKRDDDKEIADNPRRTRTPSL